VSFAFCAIWALACLAYYLVLTTYKITFHTQPDDLMRVIVAGVVPILFTPALPLHSVVRVFLGWRPRGRVRVNFDETGLKLAHVDEPRRKNTKIASSLNVQIGTSQHVVATAEGSDAPFSFRLPDEPAARRLAVALRAGNSGRSTFSFPVWGGEEVLSVLAGKNVRPSPWRKRGAFALLVSAFYGALLCTSGSYLSYGVLLIGGPFALLFGVMFFVMSWGELLASSSAGKLTIDASKICIDGEFLCYVTDHPTLTITEDRNLEIAATRIPDGKHLIKPWHVGDRHELELIKATIEAFQARTAEDTYPLREPRPSASRRMGADSRA